MAATVLLLLCPLLPQQEQEQALTKLVQLRSVASIHDGWRLRNRGLGLYAHGRGCDP